MAPEVVTRKLAFLRRLLADLKRYEGSGLDEVETHHYEVERILELLGTTGADLVAHLVGERGETPESYRDAFRRAGALGLIPEELADRLEEAAAMRNVLVHLYDEINLETVHSSIATALADFQRLIGELEPYADDAAPGRTGS
ncbi:MAG: DUF86 domain-containing protein [Acidobacteriota bacterium]|jgi:uncharacterized protein YutE (UPF0331/DUF86 family)